jgi:hypothetical protein
MSTNYLVTVSETKTASNIDFTPYIPETGAVSQSWYGGKVTMSSSGQMNLCATTAPVAGGSLTCALLLSSTAKLGVYWGSGAPTVAAAKGSLYIRTDGSTTNDRMYVATDAAGTWTPCTTGA